MLILSLPLKAEDENILLLKDSVYKLLQTDYNSDELGDMLNSLHGYYELSSPIDGIEFYSEFYEYAVKNDNFYLQENSLNSISRLYRTLGLKDLALEYLMKSLKLQESKELGNSNAWNYVAIGNLQYDQENYLQAITNYEKAIEIFDKTSKDTSLTVHAYKNTQDGFAVCLNNIALANGKMGNYEEQIKYFRKALVYRKKIGNQPGEADSYLYFGKYFLDRGNIDSAEFYLKKSYDYFDKLIKENHSQINFCLGSQFAILEIRANFYIEVQPDKSLPLLEDISELMQNGNLSYRRVDYYLLYAKYYDSKNDITKINDILNQALQFVHENNFNNKLQEIYGMLHKYNKNYGNTVLALKYIELEKQINDSIITVLRNSSFLGVQNKIKLQETENNFTKMRIQHNLAEAQLSKQKLWIIMLLVFSIGTGIAIFIFIKLITTKTKLNKKLSLLNEELHNSRNELEKTNNEKDKFFSIIAHDLRNPIGSMKSLTEVLVKNYEIFDHDVRKEFTEDIASSVNSVSKLLDNLLTWSRSQRGIIEAHPENFNLHTLVASNIDILSNWAHEKQISLINDIDKRIFVYADASMINIILQNLISNSIKYTQRAGYVKISCYESADNYEISVQDNGIGMPENIREGLFAVNSAISRPGTSNETGTGLGLIVSREFIEKHGGEIDVESAEYKGSRFFFKIPKNQYKY